MRHWWSKPKGRHRASRPLKDSEQEDDRTIEIFREINAQKDEIEPDADPEREPEPDWAHLVRSWQDATGSFQALINLQEQA